MYVTYMYGHTTFFGQIFVHIRFKKFLNNIIIKKKCNTTITITTTRTSAIASNYKAQRGWCECTLKEIDENKQNGRE